MCPQWQPRINTVYVNITGHLLRVCYGGMFFIKNDKSPSQGDWSLMANFLSDLY